MARRVVQECDLTKQEYDPAETVTLIIKKNGKKTGRTYELSADAAAKLEQQLVAGTKLDTNWNFFSDQRSEHQSTKARTFGELDVDEQDDDAKFIAEKKQNLVEEGVDLEPRQVENPKLQIAKELSDGSSCLHMNKGPIQATLKKGKRHFYTICRECREHIPVKRKSDNIAFLKATPPPGVNIKEIE